MNHPFRCPNCKEELLETENGWECSNRHHFDKSHYGYVNLMLANQGRHREEGDSKESILARKRFLSKGYYESLQKALCKEIEKLNLTSLDTFVDVACGEGYYTNEIARHFPCLSCQGIDISKQAIIEASKGKNIDHLPNIVYAIGNMDYLPLLDGSISLLLNCFAPINEGEFARVLRENGYYLRVLPGEKHLLEFKEILYPEVRLNIEKEKELKGFSYVGERHVEETIRVQKEDLLNLFLMTPYAYKTKEGQEKALLERPCLDLQISFVIRIYRKD